MKDVIVQLVRRFRLPDGRPGRSIARRRHARTDQVWPQLESHHRVLIIAEGGAGKTFEVF